MAPLRFELRLGPITPTFNVPNGVSSQPIRIAQSDLPSVQVGDTLLARVTQVAPSQSSSDQSQVRLSIEGKSLTVALSNRVQSGDVLEFKVLKTGEQVELSLVNVRGSNSPEIPKALEQQLQEILRQLNVTDKAVTLLRDALRASPRPIDNVSLPQILQAKDYEDPHGLAQKLQSFNPTRALQELPKLTPPASKISVVSAQFEQRIEQSIVKFEQPSREVTEVIPTERLAVRKLVLVLKEFGSKTQELVASGEKRVFEFVKSHVEGLVGKESHLHEVMKSIHSENAVSNLLRFVDRVARDGVLSDTPSNTRFQEFIENFHRDLKDAVINKKSDPEVRQILQRALTTIRTDFQRSDGNLPSPHVDTRIVASENARSLPPLIPPADLSASSARALKFIDVQIRTILSSSEPLLEIHQGKLPQPQYQFQELIKSLADLVTRSSYPVHESERIVRAFAKDLLDRLQAALDAGKPESTIREILSRSLKEVTTTFSFYPNVQSDADDQSIRMLEQFISAALGGESNAPQDASSKQSKQVLEILRQALRSIEPSNLESSEVGSAEVLIKLERVLKEVVSRPEMWLAQDSKLRGLITNLSTALGTVRNSPQQVDSSLKPDSEQLRQLILEILRSVEGLDSIAASKNPTFERLIPNLYNAWTPTRHAGEIQRADILASLLKDPAVKTILAMIVSQGQGEGLVTEVHDRQFITFAEELLRHFPSEIEGQQTVSKNALRKAFEQIKDMYRHSLKADTAQVSNEHRALLQIENLYRGQEFLQNINPLMQAAGEPVLLLFPMLFQGLVSKLEVSHFSPQKRIHDDENTPKKNQEGGFETVSMNITLPALGEINIQIAHREQEVRVCVQCQTQEACQQVRRLSHKLNERLQALGYSFCELSTGTSTEKSERPAWCEELLDDALTVA